MPDAPRPSHPDYIGRYRVLHRIGRGAVGVVYAAHDEVMGRDVAVKVLMTDLEEEPDVRARFLREAQLAARLTHRNIVTILDIGEENGRLFIVMELLRGRTLTECLEQRRLSIEEKVDLILEVCEGLAAAAGGGVCHRDVKPGNLFVQNDGGVKILDFGIARLASSSMTASGFIIGTPEYMSPEQARGGSVDERADIFSVGAVLYLMLTGRKPFAAPDLRAVLGMVVGQDPPPIEETEAPAALSRIVFKALAKSPDQRFQTFPELSAELARWRRRYDSDTRALAAEAAGTMETLRSLVDAEREAAALVSVSAELNLEGALSLIAEGYPSLERNGAKGLRSGLWLRRDVETVSARIQEVLTTWEGRMAVLRAGGAELALAKSALARGDGTAASASLERVLRDIPSADIHAHVARARSQVAEQRARQDKLRDLLRDSAAARAEGRLDAAISLGREALAGHPGSPEARQFLAQAEQDLAAKQAARLRECQECLDRARDAVQADQLEAAERFLQLANQTGVTCPDLAPMTELVTADRRARDLADALIDELSAEFARARQEFRENQRAAAVARLEALAARHPSEAAATLEAVRLREHHERLLAAERSRQEAERLARIAAEAMARDDDVAAMRLAEEALALMPGLQGALRTSFAAHARARERAERTAREERSRKFMDAANDLFARGRYEAAIENARRAAVLSHPDATALDLIVDAVGRLDDRAAAHDEASDVARKTAMLREVQRLAADALRAKDFGRARVLAAQAFLLDSDDRAPTEGMTRIATTASALAALEDRLSGLDSQLPPGPPTSSPALRQAGAVAWKVALYMGSKQMWRFASRWVRAHRETPGLVAKPSDSATRLEAPRRER